MGSSWPEWRFWARAMIRSSGRLATSAGRPARPQRAPAPVASPGDGSHVCLVLTMQERYSDTEGGAIATVTRNLARELIATGARVSVITPSTLDRPYDGGEVVQLSFGSRHTPSVPRRRLQSLLDRRHHYTWPGYGPYLRATRLALADRGGEVDTFVVHNDPRLATELRSAFPRAQVVLWIHNLLRGRDAQDLHAVPPAVFLVTVSAAVARWTAEEYDLPLERFVVIHNGVDLEAFRPREDFAALRGEGHDIALTLIGGQQTFGLEEAFVDDFVARLAAGMQAAGGVSLGRLPAGRTAEKLREYDVACILSRCFDPFTLTTLEAMASGCAVVASDVGGIPEAVGDAGLLVPPDDVEATTEALRRLVLDRDLLATMKEQAVRRAAQKTWRHAVEQLGTVLDSRRSRPTTVLVNNSQETFTATVSGAIGTCLWELCRAAPDDNGPWVVTRTTTEPLLDWPRLVAIPRPPEVPSQLFKATRAVRRLSGWARVDQEPYAHAVLEAIGDLGPDVVVCNNDPPVAVHLAQHLDRATTVVHWWHNLEAADQQWRRRFRESRVQSGAVSRYLARAVETAYELDPMSVAVQHNGVDTTFFTPAGEVLGPRVIGYVGRLSVEKGTDTFLLACAELARRRHDFVVQLVGDTTFGGGVTNTFGEYVGELVQAVRDQGIDVRQRGHVVRRDIGDALRDAHIHVVPSRWDEPCALTLLEGMATGLAVVGTATGGTPEVLGRAGHLVPREDPQALADVLGHLLDIPEEIERSGRAGRARALEMTWLRTWNGVTAR